MKKNETGVCFITFAVTVILCILLLALTSLIPRKAIQQNVESSSEYFMSRKVYPMVIPEQFNTLTDLYGDAILVNMLYHMDAEDGDFWSALMRGGYYRAENTDIRDGIQASLESPMEPNQDHFHYWNGLLTLLRPLFLITDMQGAGFILGGLCLLLLLLTLFFLWKKGRKSLAVCYFLGFLLVNGWMILFCVEYMAMFLIMMIENLWVVLTWKKNQDMEKRNRQLLILMVAAGVVTAYLELLTAETLTLTVPLLIEFVMRREEDDGLQKETIPLESIVFFIKNTVAWGISYALMFLLKWLLALQCFGKEAFIKSLSQAALRINGVAYTGNTTLSKTATMGQKLTGAISRNLTMLFPFKSRIETSRGVLLFLLILFLCSGVIYLYRRDDFRLKEITPFLFLGMIPFLRFLMLSSHSYQHYFFSYRALLITIMVLLYCTWEYGLKNKVGKHRTS